MNEFQNSNFQISKFPNLQSLQMEIPKLMKKKTFREMPLMEASILDMRRKSKDLDPPFSSVWIQQQNSFKNNNRCLVSQGPLLPG